MISPSFTSAEDTGSFLPKDFEEQYQELYAEARQAGEITEGDRERLAFAARALGIPDERIVQLEQALEWALEKRASITVTQPGGVLLDPSRFGEEDRQRTSVVVPAALEDGVEPTGPTATEPPPPTDHAFDEDAPPTDPQPFLPEAMAEELDQAELLTDPGSVARAPVAAAAHVPETLPSDDLVDERPTPPSQSAAPPSPSPSSPDPAPGDVWTTHAAFRVPFIVKQRSPQDELHERFLDMRRGGNLDAQYTTAAVLVRRGTATDAERAFYFTHHPTNLQRPERALTTSAWTSLLFHPHEDRTTGDIFALVAPAALLAHVSALAHDHSLVQLDPRRRQDPATSTVSAVRAFGWCAATLGLRAPPVYVAPDLDAGLEVVPAIPPASRVGARMLSGASAVELAFHCARHLTWFREEHFICTVVPATEQLEDIFLAALLVAAPELPLFPEVRMRASMNRDAILPTLSAAHIERLRALTRKFIAAGGRTSIGRWARAAELTACRAGLLLCGDLAVACSVLANEPGGPDKVAELEAFWASDAANELRRDLGVAVSPT